MANLSYSYVNALPGIFTELKLSFLLLLLDILDYLPDMHFQSHHVALTDQD